MQREINTAAQAPIIFLKQARELNATQKKRATTTTTTEKIDRKSERQKDRDEARKRADQKNNDNSPNNAQMRNGKIGRLKLKRKALRPKNDIAHAVK